MTPPTLDYYVRLTIGDLAIAMAQLRLENDQLKAQLAQMVARQSPPPLSDPQS